MIWSTYGFVALALLAYMTIWFAIGYRLKRLDVADTAWGGGFIVVALTGLVLQPSARMFLLASLVLIWGLRLASHIWRRNAFKGPDERYAELSKKWPKKTFWLQAYPQVFLLQGSLVFLVSLALSTVAAAPQETLTPVIILPVLLWLFGFSFEATADRQLKKFLRGGAKGILNTGLWKYSRHPNYFGEITQWWAIGLIALPVAYGWLGLVGAAVITFLILFVSGVPLIEKRRVNDPAYRQYQKTTSVLLPLPPRS